MNDGVDAGTLTDENIDPVVVVHLLSEPVGFRLEIDLEALEITDELDDVLERAKSAGVRRIATIGCARDVESLKSAIEIASKHPEWISATVGVHPHDAKHLDDELCDSIAEAGADPSVVAIGETGLDYHYDHSPHEAQLDAFRKQVAIAKELRKPLVIHTRSAPKETLQVLREERAGDVGGIIHCFSEDAAFADLRRADLAGVDLKTHVVHGSRFAKVTTQAV